MPVDSCHAMWAFQVGAGKCHQVVHIDTMSPANTRPHHVSTQNVFELIELNAVFN